MHLVHFNNGYVGIENIFIWKKKHTKKPHKKHTKKPHKNPHTKNHKQQNIQTTHTQVADWLGLISDRLCIKQALPPLDYQVTPK